MAGSYKYGMQAPRRGKRKPGEERHLAVTDEERACLEDEHDALLQALLKGYKSAVNIRPDQLDACGSSLRSKRFRAIVACVPWLVGLTEVPLSMCFEQFCATNPSVHEDGPHADAKSFVRYLKAEKKLSFRHELRRLCSSIECRWSRILAHIPL